MSEEGIGESDNCISSFEDDIIDISSLDFDDNDRWLYSTNSGSKGPTVDNLYTWLKSEPVSDAQLGNNSKFIDSRTFTRPKKRNCRQSLQGILDAASSLSKTVWNADDTVVLHRDKFESRNSNSTFDTTFSDGNSDLNDISLPSLPESLINDEEKKSLDPIQEYSFLSNNLLVENDQNVHNTLDTRVFNEELISMKSVNYMLKPKSAVTNFLYNNNSPFGETSKNFYLHEDQMKTSDTFANLSEMEYNDLMSMSQPSILCYSIISTEDSKNDTITIVPSNMETDITFLKEDQDNEFDKEKNSDIKVIGVCLNETRKIETDYNAVLSEETTEEYQTPSSKTSTNTLNETYDTASTLSSKCGSTEDIKSIENNQDTESGQFSDTVNLNTTLTYGTEIIENESYTVPNILTNTFVSIETEPEKVVIGSENEIQNSTFTNTNDVRHKIKKLVQKINGEDQSLSREQTQNSTFEAKNDLQSGDDTFSINNFNTTYNRDEDIAVDDNVPGSINTHIDDEDENCELNATFIPPVNQPNPSRIKSFAYQPKFSRIEPSTQKSYVKNKTKPLKCNVEDYSINHVNPTLPIMEQKHPMFNTKIQNLCDPDDRRFYTFTKFHGGSHKSVEDNSQSTVLNSTVKIDKAKPVAQKNQTFSRLSQFLGKSNPNLTTDTSKLCQPMRYTSRFQSKNVLGLRNSLKTENIDSIRSTHSVPDLNDKLSAETNFAPNSGTYQLHKTLQPCARGSTPQPSKQMGKNFWATTESDLPSPILKNNSECKESSLSSETIIVDNAKTSTPNAEMSEPSSSGYTNKVDSNSKDSRNKIQTTKSITNQLENRTKLKPPTNYNTASKQPSSGIPRPTSRIPALKFPKTSTKIPSAAVNKRLV